MPSPTRIMCKVLFYRFRLGARHGILYTSSASQNLQSTVFRKISAISPPTYHHISCHKSISLCQNAKWGFKQCFICRNPSRYLLPHLEFNEFHISFRNLGKIFCELRSGAREELRVCLGQRLFVILVWAECLRCLWVLLRNKVSTIFGIIFLLVREECVRCT